MGYARRKTQSGNPNRPLPGRSIRVEPIRSLDAISEIKRILADKPRDLCFFTLGINTGFRANELLSLTVGQVAQLQPRQSLCVKQSKNSRHRTVKLNATAIRAIQNWLAVHPNPISVSPLFVSRKATPGIDGDSPLQVPTVSLMVKQWCNKAGLIGNYGSHSLRKTWGYQQLRQNKKINYQIILPTLTRAYGHRSQDQTIDYLCIDLEEINLLFEMEL